MFLSTHKNINMFLKKKTKKKKQKNKAIWHVCICNLAQSKTQNLELLYNYITLLLNMLLT